MTLPSGLYGMRQGVWVQPATQPFLPNQISGLVAWYAADHIFGLANGAGITTWPDLSGNGYDLTQSNASLQPTWHKVVKNNLPAVQFDGAAQLMTATLPLLSAAPLTVFCVARTDNVGSVRRLWSNTRYAHGQSLQRTRFTSSGVQDYDSADGFWNTGVWSMHSLVFDGGFDVTFWKNLLLNSTATGTADSTGTLDNLTLGAAVAGVEYWLGYIGEIGFYNRDLGPERVLVDTYCRTRWATP